MVGQVRGIQLYPLPVLIYNMANSTRDTAIANKEGIININKRVDMGFNDVLKRLDSIDSSLTSLTNVQQNYVTKSELECVEARVDIIDSKFKITVGIVGALVFIGGALLTFADKIHEIFFN